MKLFLSMTVASAIALIAQDRPAPKQVREAGMTAMSIVYDGGGVRLKGYVEIKQPICVVTGPGNAPICDGYHVLRADQADYHRDTGRIEASGNVRVTREP